MPLVTCLGRQTKAPSPADYVRTDASKDQGATESDVDDNQASKCTTQKTRSHAGPKSIMGVQTKDHPHPRPKARPLPRSKHSGHLTSSAEDEIFFSNFTRCSSLSRKKSSDVNEAPEVQLADGSVLMQAEFSANGSTNGADDNESSAGPGEHSTVSGNNDDANENSVTNGREQNAIPSDGECRGAAATNKRGMNAVSSDGECGSAAATNERERDAVPSDGEGDGAALTSEQEKTPVASMTVRPRRSGAHKSYAPDHESKPAESSDSDWATVEGKRREAERAADPARPFTKTAVAFMTSEPAESSDSDSDWATVEEKQREAEHAADPARPEKQKGPAAAADHGYDAEGCDEEDPSEDEDGITHKSGRLSKEGVLKAEEFGKRVMAEATAIGKEFGKHRRVILIEVGLATKATRKESPWNQHQAWFRTLLHPSKELNLASWKVKQKAHYYTHLYKDPDHEPLWNKIRRHWDSVVASPEDLSSRESSSLMTAVHEVFAKSASYWYCTHGIHIAGITIYPGDEESGHQASGLFAGSNMVKALIDARQVDVKRLIDEFTTILKYNDLEAAQAEGKGFSFLPPPVAVPNATLLQNGQSDRDRNRMVAPPIISEAFVAAGHPFKTSNSRWTKMLDILYYMQLCIHNWPAGVPPPGHDFDLKSLSANEDEDDAEKAVSTKRKGKSKSNENRRTWGTVVEEPDVVLSIEDWSPLQRADLAGYCGEVNLIPLVIAMDGIILCRLQDSEKFIKDLPPHVARKMSTTVREESPNSDADAEHLNTGASCTMGASQSNPGALRSHSGPSSSHQEASHLHPAVLCSDYWALHPDYRAPCSDYRAPCSDYQAPHSNSGAPHSQHGASRSNPPVPMHANYDELLDYDLPP
ncbi:uncharacterized protein EDB91DRAFT_1246650 [Suillus paluster]|uniref:uncharacterized protein n=1 Tax=Suillus paluster TaxID=48578 RepID=UPI001B885ACE|nr:uncharacterized protein EDB91DRAFT_1246650 [Suillus paluster]KAG1744523.1 hypothetical protein EDB91DRAFT_1246650 [Suillus paluster]